MVAECDGGSEGDGGSGRVVGGGASGDEESLEFDASGFEVGDVNENLHDLAEILG